MHVCINYILYKCIPIIITGLGILLLLNRLINAVSCSAPCPDLPQFPERKVVLKTHHPPVQMPLIQYHPTKKLPFQNLFSLTSSIRG